MNDKIWYQLISFLLSCTVSLLIIPPTIKVAKEKKLLHPTKDKGSIKQNIAPLGGISIFIGIIFGTIFGTNGASFDEIKFIIAAILLIFFIGLYDDIMRIKYKHKIIVQLGATLILVIFGGLRVTQFFGIIDLETSTNIFSYLITILGIITIINAFVLFNGPDGLVTGLGIIAGIIFGAWFYYTEQFPFSVLAFSMSGALLGYALYNVFSKKNKILMGDTGSQITGIITGALCIKINETIAIDANHPVIISKSLLMLSIIGIPVLNALRIGVLRIINKQVFFPGRGNSHIYNALEQRFTSSSAITIFILLAVLFLVLSSYVVFLLHLNIYKQMAIIGLELLVLFCFSFKCFGRK